MPPATRRPPRAPRRARTALLIALLAAPAGCAFTTIDAHPCPPAGTTLTYANFGAPFMTRWCLSCHSTDSANRFGAPGEFNFDTAEQVRRHRARIFVRSAATNDSMPPGPVDPSLEERNQLAEWLACGAP